jgi:hypothetical protein
MSAISSSAAAANLDPAERAILLIHRDGKSRRELRRILSAARQPVLDASTIEDARSALATGEPSLVIMEDGLALEAVGDELLRDMATGERSPFVVLVAGSPGLSPQLAQRAPLNLVSGSLPRLTGSLAATVFKVLHNDIFGLEKYLAWGPIVSSLEITAAEERFAVLDELAAGVEKYGLGARMAARVRVVADELVSNALYNAPLDDTGTHYRRECDRTQPMPLVGRERVGVRYACDARTLAIEVRDQFGSLDPAQLGRYLAKCAGDRAPGKVEFDRAGAGLGVSMAYRHCDHLVYNLAPGQRCEAIALFDLSSYPQHGLQSSFNIFVQRSPLRA